ncbi:AI-2E family transporter [uncultured Modestobacter sp.]|uniref:AI-2E family transporter n=1 Tax=uncultured Modestobacter sp. TaxID=380048 RepID=UPI0026051C71|nr:AI-2E family transporter [uncultured Modestobacter sp.]
MAAEEPRPDLDARAAPDWLVRAAAVGGRLLVLAVLLWLLAGLAVQLTLVLVAVLTALLLAGVGAPAVQWASRRGVPRWLSAGAAVLLLLVVVVGVGLGLAARIASQLPQLRDALDRVSTQLSEQLGVSMPSLGDLAGSGGGGGSGIGALIGPAQTVLEVVLAVFLALALAFLFLSSGPGMWQWVLGKFGGRLREDVDAGGRAAWQTVGAYVRGLTLVALFDAVGIGLGLLLLGVPLALTLAVLQFLASYVPTIGAFVAGALAVLVAYGAEGLGTAALVLGLVVLVQQIGNDVIEPYVMKRRLPINAAMVLIAVTAGGLLWGLAGALLFVPLLAAASAAGHEVWTRHGSRPIAGG